MFSRKEIKAILNEKQLPEVEQFVDAQMQVIKSMTHAELIKYACITQANLCYSFGLISDLSNALKVMAANVEYQHFFQGALRGYFAGGASGALNIPTFDEWKKARDLENAIKCN